MSQEHERWAQFPGSNGLYLVSSLGRVRSLIPSARRRGEFQHPTVRDDGYLQICFFGRSCLLHRAVLIAFVGQAPDGYQCAHLDGNRANCALSNLAWVTVTENASHRKIHGTDGIGERNGMAKLTEEMVRDIRATCVPRSKTSNCTSIAKKYGISFQAVWDIVKGRRWAHVK